MSNLYIAAQDGIHTYSCTQDGTLSFVGLLPLDASVSIAVNGGRLFALTDGCGSPDGECAYSAVVPVWIDTWGLPTDPCPSVSLGERHCCHFTVSNDLIFAVSSSAKSISVLPLDGTEGTHHTLPETACAGVPRPQWIASIQGTPYVAVCDPGCDCISVYDHALHPVSICRLDEGCGPRALCFSADGTYAYCICSQSSEIAVLRWGDGAASFAQRKALSLPGCTSHVQDGIPSEICTDGAFVYVGCADAIAVLRITDGGATLCAHARIPVSNTANAVAVSEDLLFSVHTQDHTLRVMRMSQDRTFAAPIAAEVLPYPTSILCV